MTPLYAIKQTDRKAWGTIDKTLSIIKAPEKQCEQNITLYVNGIAMKKNNLCYAKYLYKKNTIFQETFSNV